MVRGLLPPNQSIVMKTNQQHNTIYRPYCYLIGWSKLNKFYYGVRYSRKYKCLHSTGCHPDDFWVTYFTSSATVAEFRTLYGEPDIIQIRKTFDTAEAASLWESKVLVKVLTSDLQHKFINKSYRRSVAGGNQSEETKRKISVALKGKKHSTERNLRKSQAPAGCCAMKGVPKSEEHKQKIREALKGRKQTQEHVRKQAEALKGRKQTEEHIRNVKEAKRRAREKRSGFIPYCSK